MRLDPDPLRAASHRHMIAHLTAPFEAGAVDTLLRIDPQGRAEVRESREPLVLVAPAIAVGTDRLRVRAVLDQGGTPLTLPSLEFAPLTEAGAFLPLHRPPVAPPLKRAAAFTLRLELSSISPAGVETAVPPSDLAARLEVRLLEGIVGRMIYLMASEKPRLRRLAREIATMRSLASARDDAVDRTGADLGVARFSDEIRFDPASNEIVTVVRQGPGGAIVGEPDDEYRRRLSLYRPLLMPTARAVLRLLNGPGSDTDPNRGPIAGLGLTHRFRVVEEDNEFSVAVHLVSAGSDAFRTGFLAHVRSVHLIEPNVDVSADRFLPSGKRAQENALRARLRDAFEFADGAAIAPMLGIALDRVARCRAALGVTRRLDVLRAQDPDRGNRYELGLGADLERQTAAELNAMAQALAAAGRPPSPDAEVEALLRAMTPVPAADDPEGRWLLESCGLRTVHALGANRVYVSHLPTAGLLISGPSLAALAAPTPFEILLHAPGDPGTNAVLLSGIDRAAVEWAALGRPAWTFLTDADARDRWQKSVATPPAAPAAAVVRAAGLTPMPTPEAVVPRLEKLPAELLVTLRLDTAQAAQIIAGDPAAGAQLRDLVEIFQRRGIVAMLPLVTEDDEVVLVCSVIGLPEIGSHLAGRRATGFRWYVVPIQGRGGAVKAVGSRTVFVPDGPGLSALVVIGYARRGATDPYEFRIELPDEARLDLRQYEFLMNLLEHAHPIGVDINTFSIRQRHVDLDGDGAAEPLPPTVARTFRQFRRRRHRGEVGVSIEE